jgi:hypothetical protein
MKKMMGQDPDGFYAAKLVTVRFFYERILPQVAGLFQAIKAGKRSMMDMPEEAF